MHIIDLLILLAVGVFIYSRFFSEQLPKDTQIKSRKGARLQPRVVDFPKTPQPEADDGSVPGLADLRKADPDFRAKEFLTGAKKAYQFFYKSWNAKDDEALAKLVSPQLLDTLITDLNALDADGKTPDVQIDKVQDAKLLEARLHGKSAVVDVQFTVLQAENMQQNGKPVGKTKAPKEVKAVWTFARPLTTEDPNWELEAISKPN